MNKLKTKCSTTENIEFFICEFRKAFGDEELVKNVFTCGYCYHFAVIMENMFDGYIIYHPIDNHFAFLEKLTGYIFDITGKIGYYKNDNTDVWKLWDKY